MNSHITHDYYLGGEETYERKEREKEDIYRDEDIHDEKRA